MNKIRVCIIGACGKMGKEIIKSIEENNDMILVCAIDKVNIGKKIGDIINTKNNIIINDKLEESLKKIKIDVVVEFTNANSSFENSKIVLENNIPIIIGSTGMNDDQINTLKLISKNKKVGVLLASNFAIGAVLMMKFAKQASYYFKNAEIIEYHHEDKIDAPSGTALNTSKLLDIKNNNYKKKNEKELIKNVRGGNINGIKIHSVRLPGILANQEVIFGGEGETITIKHNTINRKCFMPGIIISIKKILDKKIFIEGLENLI